MSSMTINPQGLGPAVSLRPARPVRSARPVAAQRPVARVRLTRRGRAVMTLTFLAVLLATMLTVGGSWATATLTEGGTTEPVGVVEVAPGDTLYDIASTVAAPGEVREMVHRIRELNSLPGAEIIVGQRLAVPRG